MNQVNNSHASHIPYLDRSGSAVQLMADGKPFIILGGELHNSSSSCMAYMEPIWGKLQQLNCNTVIASVSWELMEPLEGKYDFTLVDGLLDGARKHGLRLVLIWFATWKNGISTYAPTWVKSDLKRFPRMRHVSGKTSETITCFSDEARDADARAFAALMKYLREVDGDTHTVITVQVENEVGLLGSPRDYSEEAERNFNSPVPAELVSYLQANWDSLLPEVRGPLTKAAIQESFNWKEMFGPIAEEVFMAYFMARFIEHVAAAGRKEYELPLFVNAWTVQYEGELPGNYPSGGPVSRMMDIWRCAAPTIDFLAPDIYLPDFPEECASYARSGNPLFIPEARRDKWAAANVFYAIGKHDAICFAPFGIDSLDTKYTHVIGNQVQEVVQQMDTTNVGAMLSKCYKLLQGMVPVLTGYYGTGQMTGLLHYKYDVQTYDAGNYMLRIRYKKQEFPGAGIIVATTESDFLIAGHGFSVDFLAKPGNPSKVSFLAIDEGCYDNGVWIPGRRLNGDEHSVQLGEEPGVLKVSVYSYS